MTPQESIELWFRELERCGEYTQIVTGKLNLKTMERREFCFPHGQFDAVNAWHEVLRQMDSPYEQGTWKLQPRSFPPRWRQWVAFLRYLFTIPFKSADWRLTKTDWRPGQTPEKPTAGAIEHLTLDETQKLKNRAKTLGVRTNALLLWALNKAFDECLSPVGQRIWMLPATLRADFDESAIKGNWTGFIDAKFSREATPADLDRCIKKEIDWCAPYGGYIGITIGRFLGGRLLRFLVRLNFKLQIRTGVFTNLGVMGGETQTVSELGYGFPPVLRSQPVGAMTVLWYGHQVLALQLHPSLSRDPQLAANIIKSWKEFLFL